MTNFIGDYTIKLDAKGRMLMPAAFKKQMSADEDGRFVLKKDIYDNCLVMYTLGEWERQMQLIKEKTNPYNKEHTRFLREYFKGTAEVALDNNNRLLLPKKLLDLINAGTDIVLAGQFDKIEIWDKAQYDKIGEDEDGFADLASKIMGGGDTN
ncbi:MAG: division/cell wall cluster transcriptional repressor MraZ [Bacteroidales bacterium]|nr:division/cell wall cluster transcriptional repressor MraZ [Bacteroidales bacterium]